MVGKKILAGFILCLLCLGLLLVVSGSCAEEAIDHNDDLVGYWHAFEAIKGTDVVSDPAQLDYILYIDEDGTGVGMQRLNTREFTWENTDTELILQVDDDPYGSNWHGGEKRFRIVSGCLEFEVNGAVLRFAKIPLPETDTAYYNYWFMIAEDKLTAESNMIPGHINILPDYRLNSEFEWVDCWRPDESGLIIYSKNGYGFRVALRDGNLTATYYDHEYRFSSEAKLIAEESDFEYILDENGTVVVTGVADQYSEGSYEVRIPESIDGKPVTAIRAVKRDGERYYGFRNITITRLVIPDSVEIIGDRAFCESTILDIEWGHGVKKLDILAFAQVKGLRNLMLPSSLEVVSVNVFMGCEDLETVYIPSSVRIIGRREDEGELDLSNPFAGCRNLESITVAGENKNFISDSGVLYRLFTDQFGKTRIDLICYPCAKTDRAYCVPVTMDQINCIAYKAVGDNPYIECLVLPRYNLVMSCNFDNCSNLKLVIMPSASTTINSNTFYGCHEDLEVYLIWSYYDSQYGEHARIVRMKEPESQEEWNEEVARICSEHGYDNVINDTFNRGDYNDPRPEYNDAEEEEDWDCSVLDDGTVEILAYRGGEENLRIPDKLDGKRVTRIGINVFGRNEKLKTVIIPDGVTAIGVRAFGSCVNLTEITIPDSVISIEKMAFRGCTGLRKIIIPDSVTSIGDKAFAGCENLTEIRIPGSVACISRGMFESCTSLEHVIVAEGVTSIQEQAFEECSALTEINLPESLTEIGDGAFYGCTSLTDIQFPGSLARIGELAFHACTSLVKLILPDHLTEIGGGAFYNCTSLAEVTIPESVASIGYDAFHHCNSLTVFAAEDSYAAAYCQENGIRSSVADP